MGVEGGRAGEKEEREEEAGGCGKSPFNTAGEAPPRPPEALEPSRGLRALLPLLTPSASTFRPPSLPTAEEDA